MTSPLLFEGRAAIIRATSLKSGGAKQDRTADLLRARQALSQLSYSPISLCRSLFFKQDYLCRHCIKCVFRRNGKEVIQPQVPLGLPCYDFTPVMKHKVVIVLPKVRLTTSFASHSHGVTGGVYKARERIHRCVADQRLLAIPTSWRRVAASNPNLE